MSMRGRPGMLVSTAGGRQAGVHRRFLVADALHYGERVVWQATLEMTVMDTRDRCLCSPAHDRRDGREGRFDACKRPAMPSLPHATCQRP
jgi:hypothetical protein